MVTVMEMSTGKVLDEICNHCNDAYGDEVLYAAWVQTPSIEARLEEVVHSTSHTLFSAPCVDEGFMARMYACQE